MENNKFLTIFVIVNLAFVALAACGWFVLFVLHVCGVMDASGFIAEHANLVRNLGYAVCTSVWLALGAWGIIRLRNKNLGC